jgi:hypothetical protein
MQLSRLLRFVLPWFFLLFVALFMWKKCQPDWLAEKPKVAVTHHTILTKVEALGKLELVRYNFKDVVEYNKEIDFLPDSRAVLVVAGEAVGCLDLRKLTEQDLVFEGDSILNVYLPAPEICYFKVNHGQSKVLMMENTYFQDAELVDQAYKYAEKNVQRSAQNSGILQQTEVNAEKILKPLLESFSGRQVILRKQSQKPTVTLPSKR